MTHAMLFTGVDVLDGVTRRWRVENSWGSDRGKDGFYTMNDSWFGQYVFEIAARKSALPGRPAERPGRRADRAARLGPDGRPGPVARRQPCHDRPARLLSAVSSASTPAAQSSALANSSGACDMPVGLRT